MRSIMPFAAGLALLLTAPLPATAGAAEAGPLPAVADSTQPTLDKLFADLKRERREPAAERIAGRIWDQWRNSGSASIDLLMQRADEAMKAKRFGAALDFLDRVTVLEPDFAEGWNRRATVHFMMKNYRKAMADIDRTLRLEPRHFGALTGMGQIFKETGQKELALRAYERALDVYPMMRSAQSELAELADELTGQGI